MPGLGLARHDDLASVISAAGDCPVLVPVRGRVHPTVCSSCSPSPSTGCSHSGTADMAGRRAVPIFAGSGSFPADLKSLSAVHGNSDQKYLAYLILHISFLIGYAITDKRCKKSTSCFEVFSYRRGRHGVLWKIPAAVRPV